MKALQSALITDLLLSACEKASQAQRTDALGRAVVLLVNGDRGVYARFRDLTAWRRSRRAGRSARPGEP